jgi:SAM-dependent methyltransferase
MRDDVREEYVRDVAYPRKYVPQIAPPLLRLVAALNGVATPPEDDFAYCELGSANGDTLSLLAAANPGGRFVGVDFNPAHIDAAAALVARGRLENIRLLQRDFEALSRDELPDFDFIAAHGVLSWIGPAKRHAILAFVSARLKPGGLFYVSYNAMPGWAAMEPLRRLMLEHTAHMKGTTLDRAREAVEYVQRLADAGTGYFSSHPTVKSMLALMRAAGLPYVVHEHFNAHMQPFYSADVSAMMAARGLAFLGQVPLHLNVRELATPPSVKKIADGIRERTAFETLKDFGNNELFRSDVYVKGKGERTEAETRFYFEGTPFGTMTAAANLKREARFSQYTVDYKTPIYDAVLPAISDRAATAIDLAQRPELVAFGQSRVGDAFRNLVLGGQVVPMRVEVRPIAVGGRYRLRLTFNAGAIDEALRDEGPLVLASPTTGAGIHVSLLEAIALRAFVDPGEPAAWLAAFSSKCAMPLTVGDRKIKDAAELTRAVSKELERIASTIPKLIELGILEPVAQG